jgi:hypothetical protein
MSFQNSNSSNAEAKSDQAKSTDTKPCVYGKPGCTNAPASIELIDLLFGSTTGTGSIFAPSSSGGDMLSLLLSGLFSGAGSAPAKPTEDTLLRKVFESVRECEEILAQNDSIISLLESSLLEAKGTREKNTEEQKRRISKLNDLVCAYNVAHPDANLDTTIEPRLTYAQWGQYLESQNLKEQIRLSKEKSKKDIPTEDAPAEDAPTEDAPMPPMEDDPVEDDPADDGYESGPEPPAQGAGENFELLA